MIFDPSNILIVEDEEAHAELTKHATRKTNRIDSIDNKPPVLD